MVRLSEAKMGSEGDPREDQNLSIPLYASEISSIVPGPLDWRELIGKVQVTMKIAEGLGLGVTGEQSSVSSLVRSAEKINTMVRTWVDGYVSANRSPRIGILGFWYHWKIIRVWIPLQLRLAVEQVLYEKGDPWRQLVTGFGVVRDPVNRNRKG